MHMQANLLHRVGNVRARDCQILQSAGQAAIGRTVRKKVAIVAGHLLLRVYRCIRRLAVAHPDTFQEVGGALGLREEEAVRVALDVDAEKVLDRAHVLNGECGVQTLDEVLEQRCRGSC